MNVYHLGKNKKAKCGANGKTDFVVSPAFFAASKEHTCEKCKTHTGKSRK